MIGGEYVCIAVATVQRNASTAGGDARPVNPTSVRATERVIFDKLSETPTDAVQSSSRAASAPPTVAEIPGLEAELQEVRRLRGEEGLDDVLKGVQQTLAHVTGELDKRRELIPEWEDSTTCALELPEVVKFAKQHGVTDEQMEAAFVGSPEYYYAVKKGSGDDAAWIRSVYQEILFRTPSDAEVKAWYPALI